MKSAKTFIIITVLLLIFSLPLNASGLDTGGELKQLLSYGLDGEEFSTALSTYRIRLEKELGFDGRVYLSLKGDYDFFTRRGGLDLDEAYAAVYLDKTDITVGRQVISWGTADGINPTNYINPMSTESIFTGELKGEPLLSLQGTYYGEGYDLTGVLVPGFVPAEFPDENLLNTGEEIEETETEGSGGIYNYLRNLPEPANKLENMEWALRYGTLINGYDLRISYFHGWDDLPALKCRIPINPFTMQVDMDSIEFEVDYRQVNKVGVATAGNLGAFGVWAELVNVMPEKMELDSEDPLEIIRAVSINDNYLEAVIGGDYTFSNGIYGEMQYLYNGSGSLLSPYNLELTEEIEVGQYLMSRASYNLDRDN
ncbi:MAG TPA: hypothetical protein VKY40_07525, partial [Halanaerobiales bacterium]|nr:hypothetical protein [Halanaerobiales bacterium]